MVRYFSTRQIFDWQKKRCVAEKTAKNFIECRENRDKFLLFYATLYKVDGCQ